MKWGLLEIEPRKFFRNNTTFSFITGLLLLFFLVIKPIIFKAGIEEGKGEQHIQQGQVIDDLSQFSEARKQGLTEITELVDPITGKSVWVVSGTSISTPTVFDRFGAIILSNAKEMGFGITYTPAEVWNLNIDLILATSGWGSGLSYDFKDDFFTGAGIIESYQFNSQEVWIYAGKKF